MDLITKSLTMNELEKYRIPVLHHMTPSPIQIAVHEDFAKILQDNQVVPLSHRHSISCCGEGAWNRFIATETPSRIKHSKASTALDSTALTDSRSCWANADNTY